MEASKVKQSSNLNLGLIGNCGFAALVDECGGIVWCCLPRFDGDPVFNALLARNDAGSPEGGFAVELADFETTEQSYDTNTAVLRTKLSGKSGEIEIVDFAPRFHWRERMFNPRTLVRRLVPVSGSPRIRVRLTPRFDYGSRGAKISRGSNHLRFVGPEFTLRLTTNAPLDYVLNATVFNLVEPLDFILGPDETLSGGVGDTARFFMERTIDYWRGWVRRLALPLEWQDAVIRAAITLKLCTYEPTGAIVAAVTTSIPEAPDSGRNWDYRFCWLRDAFFVVRALNSLGAVKTMENYFRWLMNLVSSADGGRLQPVYGVGWDDDLSERTIANLPGYRGMGPVRAGNQAYRHAQHDVYGNVVLGAVQMFFDRRLHMEASVEDFHRLEAAGEQAFRLYDQPDAGMWELRSRARVHTSSSLMCWAACDRLAKIAERLGERRRVKAWRDRAGVIRAAIMKRAWSEDRGAFVESFEGNDLDASVLLMAEIGFIAPDDPRFVGTVAQLEKVLGRGPHMMRYEAPDDFGVPKTAFNICAFWRLDALARLGRHDESREIFEALLACRNHLGLLSEDTDPDTGESWGNFPQTYSMVGIINGAIRLSKPWETVL